MRLISAGTADAMRGPAIMIPWLEVNRDTPSEIDNCVQGLRIWQLVTQRAVVSTAPGGHTIYPKLRAAVPGVSIIPGMKTYARLRDGKFDDAAAWALVAQDMQAVAAAAKSKRVLLEHESALKGYWNSTYTLDVGKLTTALAQMGDLEVIWYPGLVGESEKVQAISAAICRAADGSGAQIVDHYAASPQALTYGWSKLAKERLNEIVTQLTMPLAYVGKQGARMYWRYTDAQKLATMFADGHDEWLIYPGARQWVGASIAVSLALAAAT